MPRRDGTGPGGSGGGGRMGGSAAGGSGGFCECPKCGTKVPHQVAQPCNTMKCPQCSSNMIRAK